MALKFLNKKGWHTGSLRNVENVWKAEQKHEAEQKKLEELRKQIGEERERSEFRLLQEQAGLVPKQERLEFLYDSGLAVGKGSSSGGFKALESPFPKNDSGTTATASASASSSSKQQQLSTPGALFEDKPQSANDAWRKLHSDPLLLIRQREQEALAHVKNNPIQMAMIHKLVESTKNKEKNSDKDDDKEPRTKHHHKKYEKHSSSKSHSGLDNAASKGEVRKKASSHKGSYGTHQSKNDELSDEDIRRKKYKDFKYKERRPGSLADPIKEKDVEQRRKKGKNGDFMFEQNRADGRMEKGDRRFLQNDSSNSAQRHDTINKRPNPVKLSDKERAARLREMQMDAELHEEQRWKRLKKAEENDAQEAVQARASGVGKTFLDAVQKSVYGTEKGGSSTIEESVRRRTHYSQGRSEATEGRAFRR